MTELIFYYCLVIAAVLSIGTSITTVDAFPVSSSSSSWQPHSQCVRNQGGRCVRYFSANAKESTTEQLIVVSLDKPLGMILEEVEEGVANGVAITGLREDGSAFASDVKDQLVGLRLVSVMGENVRNLLFDDVMNVIIDAPSPVTLELEPMNPTVDAAAEMPITDAAASPEPYPVGTVVSIKVLEDNGDETVVEAKVGDNLRLVLLQNNIEVYKGLKQKLGNCGGAGQCTFCAADFVTSDGWDERSDYEDSKLKNKPNYRLSCLNNIQGPATIRLSK